MGSLSIQPSGPAVGRVAAGDGARVGAHRHGVPGRRACGLPRHVGVRRRRVPGGRLGRCVRPAGGAPRQRAHQLQQHAVRHPPAHRRFLCR